MSIPRHRLRAAAALAGAAAHDFWLQPTSFWAAPGAPTPLTLQVGHGPARQRSPIPAARVVTFRSIGPAGATDRKTDLSLGGRQADAMLSFPTPGTHVLVFETNYAESNLPALRFNDYLAAEGLTEALRFRQRTGSSDEPGREIYTRNAKALVQVGSSGARRQPQVTAPVGLTLEIVPEVNPYALTPGASLPIRVLYEGRPLPGALVKLTDLSADERPVETHLSDGAGRAVFRPPHPGTWLLNVIWSKPLANNRRADFATVFSSLTFGTQRVAARR